MPAWYDTYIDEKAWKAAWDGWNPSWTAADVQAKVESFVSHLARQRTTLQRARGQLLTDEDRKIWAELTSAHLRLVAPLAADSRAAPAVGAVPVVAVAVIVAGLAIGAWACAWAVAHLAEAINFASATDLWQRELEIRWQAAQRGLKLPDTTIPNYAPNNPRAPEKPGDDDGAWMWGLLGAGLLAGAAYLLPKFTGRS